MPLLEQHRQPRVSGDNVTFLMRVLPYALGFGALPGMVSGAVLAERNGYPFLLGALVGLFVGAFFVIGVAWVFVQGGAGLVTRMLMPSGDTTPCVHDFSVIEAHVVRADYAAAAVLWNDAVAERPGDVEVRVRAGDFFAGAGADPARAMALFREVQAFPHARADRLLYVSQRMVDLYLGPLADKGRAVVELRRMIEKWPNSAPARHGREALARLKSELNAD